MFRTLLTTALILLWAPGVLSCSCLDQSLTKKFQSDNYKTIGQFCNNTPSPDTANQPKLSTDKVEWTLNLHTIYKGDCSLKKGTVIKASSRASGASCGVKVGPTGCYIIGLDSNNRFGLCGIASRLEGAGKQFLEEIEKNDQCSCDEEW